VKKSRSRLLRWCAFDVSQMLGRECKKSGRDSSTAQADSFAGAKEEEKASACSARNDNFEQHGVAALLPAAGRRNDREWVVGVDCMEALMSRIRESR
jgi:hypothetical protein